MAGLAGGWVRSGRGIRRGVPGGTAAAWAGSSPVWRAGRCRWPRSCLMRLRLGPPRWWSGWRVTLRVGEGRLAGLRW